MSDQIVTIAEIRRRARAAHAAGQLLEDCPLPWHSNARATWEAEYAILDAQAQPSHAAPAARQRVEQEQAA
jgi:hypothetical protein